MKQKEMTKTIVTISKWKKSFCLYGQFIQRFRS